MEAIARTPEPPYYAVIFTNVQSDDTDGYNEMAAQMVALAEKQPGYLGFESTRNKLGIAISYWTDIDAIKQWKQHVDHLVAQQKGRTQWYTQYATRVCKVERAYSHGITDDVSD